MKPPIRLLSILFVTLVHHPLTHGALTIDSFATAQGPLTGAGSFNAVSGAGILGGERDVELYSFPSTSSFSIASGVLNLTQTAGFTDIFVTYDGADNSSSLSMGLGGLNLLSSGTTFQVAVPATTSSAPHAHLWLRAYTTDFQYSETHLVLGAGNFPGTIDIPFNTMEAFGTGANFSNINALRMELAIGSGISMDLHMASVSVVPEPSTGVLLLSGPFFAACARRRRR